VFPEEWLWRVGDILRCGDVYAYIVGRSPTFYQYQIAVQKRGMIGWWPTGPVVRMPKTAMESEKVHFHGVAR
jgi:hypothetical protein